MSEVDVKDVLYGLYREMREPLIPSDYRDLYASKPDLRKRAEEDTLDRRVEPVAKLLENMVNGADDHLQYLAKRLARRMHRTLIQSFVSKFIIPFLQTLVADGSEGYLDLRNQAAFEFAKKALEANDIRANERTSLPLI